MRANSLTNLGVSLDYNVASDYDKVLVLSGIASEIEELAPHANEIATIVANLPDVLTVQEASELVNNLTVKVTTLPAGSTATSELVGTEIRLGIPAGTQGVQGIQGPKGYKGDKGDIGLTGAKGPAGATGAQGPKGDTGDHVHRISYQRSKDPLGNEVGPTEPGRPGYNDTYTMWASQEELPETYIGEFTVHNGLNTLTAEEQGKFDSIEFGATADQTANELLTLLKTVDGSGSGLDADLLDGQEGVYYLNASNINTGTIDDDRLPDTITSSTTGNAATATKLATDRTINGVSFDGTANITISDNTKLTKINPVITGSITEQVYNLTGTAITPANGTIQYKTVSSNTTFTETLTSGQSVLLRLLNASNYTITFPTITWVGAAAPTLTANCAIVVWKEQTTLYGAFVGSFV